MGIVKVILLAGVVSLRVCQPISLSQRFYFSHFVQLGSALLCLDTDQELCYKLWVALLLCESSGFGPQYQMFFPVRRALTPSDMLPCLVSTLSRDVSSLISFCFRTS